MPRIDDYQSKLLDEIAALKHQLKACEKHLEVVRNQAEEWKQKAELYDKEDGRKMTLNPETINEWKMKEIIEADKWRNAQKMLGLLTPETINEWKQKAEQYDALGGADYVLMHKDEVKELKEKASGLYKCSQCPQWEKAEKWDAQQGLLSDTLTDIRKDLDLIFQGLEVKEKCQCDKGYLWDNPNYFGQKRICHFCHGTGFITRPPTGEEVREFLEWLFSSIRTRHDFYQFLMHRTFTLKSGAMLRMMVRRTVEK